MRGYQCAPSRLNSWGAWRQESSTLTSRPDARGAWRQGNITHSPPGQSWGAWRQGSITHSPPGQTWGAWRQGSITCSPPGQMHEEHGGKEASHTHLQARCMRSMEARKHHTLTSRPNVRCMEAPSMLVPVKQGGQTTSSLPVVCPQLGCQRVAGEGTPMASCCIAAWGAPCCAGDLFSAAVFLGGQARQGPLLAGMGSCCRSGQGWGGSSGVWVWAWCAQPLGMYSRSPAAGKQ